MSRARALLCGMLEGTAVSLRIYGMIFQDLADRAAHRGGLRPRLETWAAIGAIAAISPDRVPERFWKGAAS